METAFVADFFDGHVAERWPVRAAFDGDELTFLAANAIHRFRTAEITVDRGAGNIAYRLTLPQGGTLTTFEHHAIDAHFPMSVGTRRLRWLEATPWVSTLCVLLVMLLLFFGGRAGVPYVADWVVDRMPQATDDSLGDGALRSLDRFVFKPSTADAQRRDRLLAAFDQLANTAGASDNTKLHFRNGAKIGPNAFALPGGNIIVTDELLDLIPSDEAIIAILAHELGHLKRRHSLRLVVRQSIMALYVLAVTGDASNIAGLGAYAPQLIHELHYSREMEREADAFAHALLVMTGRSPASLGDALELIQRRIEANGNRESGADSILSTHPITRERIEAARNAAQAK